MKVADARDQPLTAREMAHAVRGMARSICLFLVLACLAFQPGSGFAQGAAASPQTVVHLLDYLGVDYAGAVQDGKVRNADEFKEMLEFSGQVVASLKSLPENPQRSMLVADAGKLAHMVQGKAAAGDVAAVARKLRWDVINAYGVAVSPKATPDLKAGATLYQSLCAGCHGAEGRGDGAAAARLEPKPSDFHDRERMAQRSVFGIYNTVTLGVKDTAMAPFANLAENDRWALALHVAGYPATAQERALGEKLWKDGKARQAFPDLVNLTTLSADEVKERFGPEAVAIQSYLIAHPEALAQGRPGPIAFALAKVDEAVAAYRAGERAAAQQLAIKAYLEGYELIETSLSNVDERLMREGERDMMALRELIRAEAPLPAVEAQATRVAAMLERVRERLDAGTLSPAATFTSALVILLREGLEALLVVAAIVAFLIKANRRDALVWVHAGWVSAVALGLVTWAVASYAIGISGAHREITEGVTGLVAAAMLVYVGYWLHSKASAHAWQHFINDRVGSALASRTLWALAGVSFLAVYREIFETVLFYQALWVQAGESARGAFVGGVAAAAAALAGIGWGIFRYSLRLPLGPFFNVMSALMCVLAVVLAGKGVAALQEAGIVGVQVIGVPPVPLLGFFPTVQTLAAQAVVITCIAALLYFARQRNSTRQSEAKHG
jgi:high-affinity iron transporter